MRKAPYNFSISIVYIYFPTEYLNFRIENGGPDNGLISTIHLLQGICFTLNNPERYSFIRYTRKIFQE